MSRLRGMGIKRGLSDSRGQCPVMPFPSRRERGDFYSLEVCGLWACRSRESGTAHKNGHRHDTGAARKNNAVEGCPKAAGGGEAPLTDQEGSEVRREGGRAFPGRHLGDRVFPGVSLAGSDFHRREQDGSVASRGRLAGRGSVS